MVSVISLCACYVAMRLIAVVFMACLLLLTSVDEPAVERAAVDNANQRLDCDLLEFIHLECCSILVWSFCCQPTSAAVIRRRNVLNLASQYMQT